MSTIAVGGKQAGWHPAALTTQVPDPHLRGKQVLDAARESAASFAPIRAGDKLTWPSAAQVTIVELLVCGRKRAWKTLLWWPLLYVSLRAPVNHWMAAILALHLVGALVQGQASSLPV